MFDKPITAILWFYKEDNSGIPRDIDILHAYQGLPNLEIIKSYFPDNVVVVCDDLTQDFNENKKNTSFLRELYSVISHHYNVCVFTINQNLFSICRDVRLNSSHLVLLKNYGDLLTVQNVLRQQFKNWKSVLSAYEECTKRPHGYLLINNSNHAEECERILTNVEDQFPIAYII